MPFINGIEVSDANGRAVIDRDIGGSALSRMGGWLYDNGVAPPKLMTNSTGAGGPFGTLNGMLVDASAQVAMTLNTAPVGSFFIGGLRVDSTGRLYVSTANTIVNYVHGWPVDANGALCAI
jgi:hypothetical protein